MPDKLFDFSEEQKMMQAAESDYANIEMKIKSDYEYIISEVHSKKELVNSLRLAVHENMSRTKELQEELDDIRRRYETLDLQLQIAREKGLPQKKPQQGGNKRLPGKIIVNSNIVEIDKITVNILRKF